MGAAVAGLLILVVFFTGQAMMSRATIHGNLLVAIATKEAVRFSGERSRTVIAINGTNTDGFCNLTVDVDNTGAVAIKDIPIMDVVVQFPGGSTAPQRLVYVGSGPLATGEWTTNFLYRASSNPQYLIQVRPCKSAASYCWRCLNQQEW